MLKGRIFARMALGFAVVMCCGFTGRNGAQTGAYCTETADMLLDACKASVMDDGAVGKGIAAAIAHRQIDCAVWSNMNVTMNASARITVIAGVGQGAWSIANTERIAALTCSRADRVCLRAVVSRLALVNRIGKRA